MAELTPEDEIKIHKKAKDVVSDLGVDLNILRKKA